MKTLHFAKRVLALTLASLLAFALPTLAADTGTFGMEKIEYKGWKNNLRLSNGEVELIVTLDVGPRVISYRLKDGKNVFKEYEEQLGKTGEPDWQIRGGHRLWVGPEDLTRTYFPDNRPVRHEVVNRGPIASIAPNPLTVRFIPPPETEYGIQKEIEIQLPPAGSRVKVIHRLTNIGDKPTSLAPWVLTVMAAGGVEVIPLAAKKPHPGPPENALSAKDYAPNLTMSVWPFTDFKDPRWNFGTKYITLRHDAKKGPTKIGLSHKMGWVGYLNNRTLFIKRFKYEDGEHYPDGGVNFETFTNPDMVEIETLGPVERLAPGKKVEHVERWELIADLEDFKDEAEIDVNILPKVKPK